MTRDTCGCTDCAVVKVGDRPVNCGVAAFTGINSRNVCGALALGDHPVMTTFTGANHLRVIDQGINRRPCRGVMTRLAGIRRVDMRRALSCRTRTIMTTHASCRTNRAVIKRSHRPIHCRVTIITLRGGDEMRCTLASGNGAIVAGITHANHLCVIYSKHRDPTTTVVVAGVTSIRGIDMRGILADSGCTVMTRHAGADDFIVIHRCGSDRRPRRNDMTSLA